MLYTNLQLCYVIFTPTCGCRKNLIWKKNRPFNIINLLYNLQYNETLYSNLLHWYISI